MDSVELLASPPADASWDFPPVMVWWDPETGNARAYSWDQGMARRWLTSDGFVTSGVVRSPKSLASLCDVVATSKTVVSDGAALVDIARAAFFFGGYAAVEAVAAGLQDPRVAREALLETSEPRSNARDRSVDPCLPAYTAIWEACLTNPALVEEAARVASVRPRASFEAICEARTASLLSTDLYKRGMVEASAAVTGRLSEILRGNVPPPRDVPKSPRMRARRTRVPEGGLSLVFHADLDGASGVLRPTSLLIRNVEAFGARASFEGLPDPTGPGWEIPAFGVVSRDGAYDARCVANLATVATHGGVSEAVDGKCAVSMYVLADFLGCDRARRFALRALKRIDAVEAVRHMVGSDPGMCSRLWSEASGTLAESFWEYGRADCADALSGASVEQVAALCDPEGVCRGTADRVGGRLGAVLYAAATVLGGPEGQAVASDAVSRALDHPAKKTPWGRHDADSRILTVVVALDGCARKDDLGGSIAAHVHGTALAHRIRK